MTAKETEDIVDPAQSSHSANYDALDSNIANNVLAANSSACDVSITDKTQTAAPDMSDDHSATGLLEIPEDAGVIDGKGEFISGGTTSLVELLPSGDIIKTPWPNGIGASDRLKEIAVEAQIYKKLGEHPRLVKLKAWDPEAHTLTLEYMSNGTLKDYVKSHSKEISMVQRFRWITQAAEGLDLLHSADILHCDTGPHNFLLDVDLELKIADFSGSSLEGSRAMVCPGRRYTAPDPNWNFRNPATVKEDLFAFAGLVYFILTDKAPFEELPDETVDEKFLAGEFPDLDGIPFAAIIELCWKQEASSVRQVREYLDKWSQQEISKLGETSTRERIC